MGYILDAIVIVIVILLAVRNSRKKQIRVILETVCYVLAVTAAIPLSIFCSRFVWTEFFRAPMAAKIEMAVKQSPYIVTSKTNLDRMLDELPSTIGNASGSYGIASEENLTTLDSLLIGNLNASPPKIVDIIARPVIEGIFRGVLCVLFFIGALFLLKALAALVENAMEPPDRKSRNVILGGIMGAFKGLVIISLIITAAMLLLPALPFELPIFSPSFLEHSFFFRMLCAQNPIMLFLGDKVYPVVLF